MVCDEIRKEDSGKFMFLGVYGGTIVLRGLPAAAPLLTVYISGKIQNPEFKIVNFCIEDPRKRKLIEVSPEFSIESLEESFNFIFVVRNPTFENSGEYLIKLGFDSVPRKIGSFLVREPTNDEERRRLGLN